MKLLFRDAFARMPLLAVLRGLHPHEAETVGDKLIDAGFRVLEVTLDSPEPYQSLTILAERFGTEALIAAGTVLRAEQADAVARAGGRAIVAPNLNEDVVRAARRAGLQAMPGVLTPTEAFTALDLGADALKLFPGDAISPSVVRGLRAVLPEETLLCVTGGVNTGNLAAYLSAGASAAGIGSALFKPGKPLSDMAADARRLIDAVRGSG